MLFQKMLKELRLEKKITQRQLADFLNVHHTTVKDWEVRGCEPSYQTLTNIAKFFGVSTDYLLGLEY